MDDKFSFEDLKVYQKALSFIDEVYLITSKFPKEEMFSLTAQLRRAAHSIALNIAEGSGGTDPEFINFLRIARKSVNECVVCISIAHHQKYVDENKQTEFRKDLSELSRMINGLIKSLQSKKWQNQTKY